MSIFVCLVEKSNNNTTNKVLPSPEKENNNNKGNKQKYTPQITELMAQTVRKVSLYMFSLF
jgi:hypothetical protein